MNDGEERRPLWQELLLLALPIILTEGVVLLREHLHRARKRRKKQEQHDIPIPRA